MILHFFQSSGSFFFTRYSSVFASFIFRPLSFSFRSVMFFSFSVLNFLLLAAHPMSCAYFGLMIVLYSGASQYVYGLSILVCVVFTLRVVLQAFAKYSVKIIRLRQSPCGMLILVKNESDVSLPTFTFRVTSSTSSKIEFGLV